MEKKDQTVFQLPDESEYPRELTASCELLECFSAAHGVETLLARNRKTSELVTVKCFHMDHPLYLPSEPEPLRKLNAPPMPLFLGEYRNDEMRCVVRQYIPGDTLEARVALQPVEEEEALDIGIRLCDQLQALHTSDPPIIHRDVKPQNIILREDGTPVLIDFGISRISTVKETDTVIFGTQGFAPPEQYGFSSTDARSDIYSLGMVLHWLLHGNTLPPESAATPLEKVILRMTAFDPKHRFATAAQAKKALQNARPQACRRRLYCMAAATCLLLALCVLGAVSLVRNSRNRVDFSQPLVAEAVRLNLGLPEGAALTPELLARVHGIYIVGDTACPDAESFYSAVSRWDASAASVRGMLENLEDLSLLPNLEQACVAAQQIRDISALRSLSSLNKVEFKHNEIEDITVLSDLKRLTSVGLNDNPVRDLSPLLGCPELAFLDLCDVRTYDPAVIAELGNFDYLDLSNPTESYRYLGRRSILSLALAWTGLSSLEDLSGITRLESLDISHTSVSDLSPLLIHQGLKELKLSGLHIKDLTPLLSLPMLQRVTLTRNLKPMADQLPSPAFEIVVDPS